MLPVYYRQLLFVLFLFSGTTLWAQSGSFQPTQTIRGRVLDSDTDQPVARATLTVEDQNQSYSTIADESGAFRIEKVPVGHYRITVRSVGYETQTIAEVLVESGKEQVLEVRLRAGTETLAETVVKGIRPDNTLTSIQTITTEQILRFPATYLDPARLATSFPGVVNTNDQANNLSVRGNSPNGLVWRLEGAEIVNPNHLSNAGTLGDRPTASGGGVNILSAQLLNSTRFLSGAFAPEYGNTLAGIMDMRFRTGNNERHEFTAQAGLIGLDLAAEGPLNKRTGSSYLVNYRYSFTGLLGLMGISFGGEDIRFQDLAFNITQPLRKNGKITLFGMAGNSSNVFNAPTDPTLREIDKDRYDITFRSYMVASGLTYTQSLNDRYSLRISLVGSTNDNTRSQSPAQSLTLPFPAYQYDQSANARITLHSALTFRPSEQHRWQAGLYLTRWYGAIGLWKDSQPVMVTPRPGRIQDGSLWAWLIQPYVNYQITSGEKFMANLGVHGNVFTYNSNSVSLEPRASLRWNPVPAHTVTLAYGLHSQTQQPVVYLATKGNIWDATPGIGNGGIGFTKAHHIVAGYTYRVSESTSLKSEVYYQRLFNVPVSTLAGSAYSVLNLLDINEYAQQPMPLANKGAGRNQGIELTLQRLLEKNYYFLVSGSVYDSKFKALDGVWRDTRYNGRHTLSLTGGKEYKRNRSGKTSTWGYNAKIAQLGGFRDRPIDVAASRVQNTTVYASNDYSIRLPDYFRVDARIYWRKSHVKYSRTLSLDLLNVTGAKNQAYSYFDALKGDVVKQYQLGILPILNYRWEF